MLYECKDEHKHIMENLLEILSVAEGKISASAIMLLQEDGVCLTEIDQASMNDLLLMKGHMELAVIHRYNEVNPPEVIEFTGTTDDEDDE